MPSNRAILRDIHDLSLDPKKNHRKVDTEGRLKKQPTSQSNNLENVAADNKESTNENVETLSQHEKEVENHTKNALVELQAKNILHKNVTIENNKSVVQNQKFNKKPNRK